MNYFIATKKIEWVKPKNIFYVMVKPSLLKHTKLLCDDSGVKCQIGTESNLSGTWRPERAWHWATCFFIVQTAINGIQLNIGNELL